MFMKMVKSLVEILYPCLNELTLREQHMFPLPLTYATPLFSNQHITTCIFSVLCCCTFPLYNNPTAQCNGRHLPSAPRALWNSGAALLAQQQHAPAYAPPPRQPFNSYIPLGSLNIFSMLLSYIILLPGSIVFTIPSFYSLLSYFGTAHFTPGPLPALPMPSSHILTSRVSFEISFEFVIINKMEMEVFYGHLLWLLRFILFVLKVSSMQLEKTEVRASNLCIGPDIVGSV